MRACSVALLTRGSLSNRALYSEILVFSSCKAGKHERESRDVTRSKVMERKD